MTYLKYFEPHVKGLKKSGKQYLGYCPFHNDDGSVKKGLSLDPEKGVWHCFSCGAKGNVFSFFKQLNIPIPDELRSNSPPAWRGFKYLKYRSPNEGQEQWVPENLSPPNPKWQKKADYFLKSAIIVLNRSQKCDNVRDWLMTDRGLNGEMFKRLGWNPETTHYSKESWGLEEPGDLWIPAGLVIAVIQDGFIQRVQIRRHDEGDHILLSGSSSKVPMRLVNGNRHVIIVESDLDALLLWRVAGDLVDVVALRSASTRPDFKTTEILRAAERVYVALDSDSGGENNIGWWLTNFPNAQNFPLPPGVGKDPGEAFKNHFNLRGWIREEILRKAKPGQEIYDLSGIKQPNNDMKYTDEERRILREKQLDSLENEQVNLIKQVFEGQICEQIV